MCEIVKHTVGYGHWWWSQCRIVLNLHSLRWPAGSDFCGSKKHKNKNPTYFSLHYDLRQYFPNKVMISAATLKSYLKVAFIFYKISPHLEQINGKTGYALSCDWNACSGLRF